MNIKTFLKNNCSNFDSHHKCCLLTDEDCLVLAGRRCGYFEKYLLRPYDYRFRLPGVDYAKLFAQYAELTNAETVRIRQRRCDCGEPLSFGKRYCDKCKKKRRKESYHNHRNSKSLKRHS
jgi:hypothetical protein